MSNFDLKAYMDITPEIEEAVRTGKPVVALESTILSHGMPYPENLSFAREVEKIIREDVSDPRTDCMFSITHVDVTRDLRYAKVYISIYEEEKRAPMMKALKTAAGFIRHNLGRRVQLRYTPELLFELDTTIEYGVHIASLINQVRKTEESRSHDAGEAEV